MIIRLADRLLLANPIFSHLVEFFNCWKYGIARGTLIAKVVAIVVKSDKEFLFFFLSMIMRIPKVQDAKVPATDMDFSSVCHNAD